MGTTCTQARIELHALGKGAPVHLQLVVCLHPSDDVRFGWGQHLSRAGDGVDGRFQLSRQGGVVGCKVQQQAQQQWQQQAQQQCQQRGSGSGSSSGSSVMPTTWSRPTYIQVHAGIKCTH